MFRQPEVLPDYFSGNYPLDQPKTILISGQFYGMTIYSHLLK